MSDLLVAVDYSVSFRFIGLVAAREHRVKSTDFLRRASWVRHVAGLGRRERVVYLHRFPSRFSRVMGYLEYVRYFRGVEECNRFLEGVVASAVIVDPSLYPHIPFPRKIREDRVRERHRRVLALLADNVAYYTRWILQVKHRPAELRRIVK